MDTGILVTVLVTGGVMAVILAAVIVVTRRVGAGAEARADDLRADVERRGEGWVIPLQGAVCRRGRRARPGDKGGGVLGLTGRRVVFEPISGERLSVPLARVTAARLGGGRSGSGGRPRLLLTLDDGDEVGFVVGDGAEWAAGLAGAGVTVEGAAGE